MSTIKRSDINVCVGDKRHIYILPIAIDDEFAHAISQFGTLKKYVIGKRHLYFLEEPGEMKLRFEIGKKEVDASFLGRLYRKKITLFEEFLVAYFKKRIRKEP